MKKTYWQPTMMVVRLQQQSIICSSSSKVSRVSTDLTGDDAIGYGGSGTGPARARQHSGIDWDDDGSE